MLIVEYWTDTPLLKTAFEYVPEISVYPEEGYIDERAHYIFWASGGDFNAFEEGLDADPTVTNSKTLTELETRKLYRVTSTEQGGDSGRLQVWRDLNLVLLDGEGTLDGWIHRMRFPDREALTQYNRIFQEQGWPFHLQTVYRESEARNDVDALLTDKQKEALVAAYEIGHFDIPQTASQTDVAAEVGISSQALSERLQRGIRTLIEATDISP
ncbi:bacterio-opsin activator [Natrinema sp. CBA1119]|uniref:helix-turn-helix domain-containing protein n=1 Tax=Natrinema sp. CBA1119 TaxID=1608465 RepID=UPI000BFA13D1|nr:helix-turn-helix domain-containing protein [Natrinema sp. CBA1119]PGF14067.1 bacterio-opsin activator [Natrinema sp. CBA1119]